MLKRRNHKGNRFDVSPGNIEVLRAVPEMMLVDKYRVLLRELTIAYIIDKRRVHGDGPVVLLSDMKDFIGRAERLSKRSKGKTI